MESRKASYYKPKSTDDSTRMRRTPPPEIRISDKERVAIKVDGTRIPVVDATEKQSILCAPSNDDKKNSIPGDHQWCMFCMYCRRCFGSELVYFTRTRAYIELYRRGKAELRRFILEKPARDMIKDFDKGKPLLLDTVILRAPRGTERLNSPERRASYERWAQKRREQGRKAYIKGSLSGKKRPVRIDGVRDPATGMFQFHYAT